MNLYREIIEECVIGYLATSDSGQPRVRPMSFVLAQGGCLWSSTWDISGKVRELRQNEKVEIAFLDSKNRQLRIEGTVDLSGGTDKKKRLLELNPKVKNHFPDEHAEHFVHIEINPTRVRWKGTGFGEYEEIKNLTEA